MGRPDRISFWSAIPTICLIIDGGKGHLLAVSRIVEELSGEMKPPALIAIAKEREQGAKGDKLYLPGRKNPLRLNGDHPVLLLLMGIRDEVHRRAVTYHRKLRKKETIKSALDLVPGVGPSKRALLLKEFGSIEAISKATEDEIVRIKGVTKSMAGEIKKILNSSGQDSDI